MSEGGPEIEETRVRQMDVRQKPEPVQPPMLFARTQDVLDRIERQLGEPLLTYWNSSKGSICQNDVPGLYGLLQRVGRVKRLTLFVKSDGGNGQASLRLVNLLRRYAEHLTVLVPFECQSAATMLALGADRIMMGPLAHLSAVDTSLTHDLSPIDRDNDRVSVSQDELQRVVALWQRQASREETSDQRNPYEALFKYVHPLVIGAVDRISALSTKLCTEILSYHMTDAEKVERISNTLNSGYPSHSYPITLREAQRIGLHAEAMEDEVSHLLFELNEIYAEMGQNAYVDYDEVNAHDNSIANVMETRGFQCFYQINKDWHYRAAERRWVGLNDKSGWKRAQMVDGALSVSTFHIR